MGASYGRAFISELKNEVVLDDFEKMQVSTFQEFYQFQNFLFEFEDSWSFENWVAPDKCRWNILSIKPPNEEDNSLVQISVTTFCDSSKGAAKWFKLSDWNREAGDFLAKKNDRIIRELKKTFRSIRIAYGNDFFHQYKHPKTLFDKIDGQGNLINTGVRLYQNF